MGKTILVIDDEPGIRESFRMIFKDLYPVLFAGSGKEGLNLANKDISLIFLDYKLPDLSGLDVLREIKTHHPSIPVIMITAYGSENLCLKAFRHGAIDYIKKPFDIEEIKAKVELLLKIRSTGAEVRQTVFLECNNSGRKPEGIPLHVFNGLVRAKRYIDEHYMSEISLSPVIKEAGMSRAYFCKYFKLLTGYSFASYLNNLKIKRATEILSNKNLSITDIAIASGYSDVSYFSRMFRKIIGCPPTRYRGPKGSN